jgi:HAD superfamily hydrolase (TIGR01509 family)
MAVEGVVFDLDGVIVESEQLWNRAKRELVLEQGATWPDDAERTMMGMSSPEWSAYLHGLGLPLDAEEINRRVVERMLALYEEDLPLLPGAVDAVRRLADRWPLGLATSSNRPVIEVVLDRADLEACFTAVVSSEEVARGKPAPDVYLAAARDLGVRAAACAAIEDSSNGIRAAHAADMTVIAVPNREYAPDPSALALAHLELHSLELLTVQSVEQAAAYKAG